MQKYKIKSENLINQNGNYAANQIQTYIYGEEVNQCIFQSYDKTICKIDYCTGEDFNILILDKNAYDYSKTTSKYLNIFLKDKYLNIEMIKKSYNIGGCIIDDKYKPLKVIIEDLNN